MRQIKNWIQCTALVLFTLLAAACGGLGQNSAVETALNVTGPASFSNPQVVAGLPLCIAGLPEAGKNKVRKAVNIWNDAYPAGELRTTDPEKCAPLQPIVMIDESMPEARSGYTVPSLRQGFRIKFRSLAHMRLCTVVHEVGHYLGLFKHADKDAEPPGPMTEGPRAPCLPTVADVAILTRTYQGKVSL